MADGRGNTSYTYDNMDRLKTKITPQGTLTYGYDTVGNVTSMVSSNVNGTSVGYTYDELNRLNTVVDNKLSAGQITTTYTYDPANNLATVTYPNGVQSTFVYDPLNRLTSMPTTRSGLSPIRTVWPATGCTGPGTWRGGGRMVCWSFWAVPTRR